MKLSSAASNQLSLDLGGSANEAEENVGNTAENSSFPSSKVFLGNAVFAETSRSAGRLNAAFIPPSEEQAFRNEREQLLDLKFAGTITRQQENRLQYVRWTLDRIEDARDGRALDDLESLIDRYEMLVDEIQGLRAQIERASRKS
jgi:hypothetical protein